MFKKKPTIKPLAPLRSSDRRRLADQIIKDYQIESEPTTSPEEQSPEQKAEATAARTCLRNALLPENLQSARFTTTHGPDLKQASGTFYVGGHNGEEARILWFQIESRMYPSIYTLWRNPNIVPLLFTHPIVVQKLRGGADLMTPGLARGPPFPSGSKKGAVVAIACTESPSVPIAVGVCEIDVSGLHEVQGTKGHAVENLHWVGDELWSYSTGSKVGQDPPNRIEGWEQTLDQTGLTKQAGDLALEDEDDGGVSLAYDSTKAESKPADGGSCPVEQGNTPAESSTDPIPELSQKEIDDAFRNAFLYGVHKYKTSNDGQPNFGLVFPLSQSFVMSNLVQPFLPAYTPEHNQQLQIKKTSWKNIKKFIKSLDKEKIIKSREKDGHETVIIDIDFNDAAIADFKPYRLPQKEAVAGSAPGRGEPDKIDSTDDALGQKLRVVTYLRPTPKLQSVFAASSPKSLYTPPELREVITAYIESENLVSATNKRLVQLNPTLANSVFDGSGPLDNEIIAKGTIPRDALIDRVRQAMSSSYAVVRNDADPSSVKTKSGVPPKIHITLETRSGNKTATKVSGLEVYFVNPRPLADELRKVCAGSTSVEPLAGAAKKNEKEVMEVMIQGPQQAAVVKALEKRGVDKRWIELVDKTKGKKR